MRDEHGLETDKHAGRASLRVVVDPENPDPVALGRAGEVIRDGGLVAFPTETVYGLGADALNVDATASIFAAKGRPSSDPLIVHVASVEDARGLTRTWGESAERVSRRFWPGPLTIVMEKADIVPDGITAGLSTVAIRVPAHPVARGLIEAARRPIAAPSANRFGRISPTTAEAVEAELFGRYDMVIDAGPTSIGVESTVLDLSGPVPSVLRPGGVTVEQLRATLGEVHVLSGHSQSEETDARAPGQFLGHYSPSTPLVAVDAEPGTETEVVTGLQDRGLVVAVVDLPDGLEEAARELYTRLRSADGSADIIVVSMVEPTAIGRAINDRLFRAAQGKVIESLDQTVLDDLVARLDGDRTGSPR